MTRFPRWHSVAITMLLLGAILALGACAANVKSKSASEAKAAGKFDTVIQTYKNGQFLLDGAVLSSLDLSSHFAYLRDQNKLPDTVLLEGSDASRIRKPHLRYMASMAWTYGFTVYYSDDGELRQIVPTNANGETELREAPKADKKDEHSELDKHDAAHGGLGPDFGH